MWNTLLHYIDKNVALQFCHLELTLFENILSQSILSSMSQASSKISHRVFSRAMFTKMSRWSELANGGMVLQLISDNGQDRNAKSIKEVLQNDSL